MTLQKQAKENWMKDKELGREKDSRNDKLNRTENSKLQRKRESSYPHVKHPYV